MSTISIAVIGAGPVGCTLTRILQKSAFAEHIKVTIFECDESIHQRPQGGTLDLRQGTGLEAIRMAGLWEEFEKHARFDGESLIVSDKNLIKYLSMKGEAEAKKNARAPEIDRSKLRQMLLHSLSRSTVQFDKKLDHIIKSIDDNQFTLYFRDGDKQDFDLVFGADGAFSKTRKFLSDVQPYFSGIAGYSFTIAKASKVAPEIIQLIQGGNIFSFHDHLFLSHQQMGDDIINVALYWKESNEDWYKHLSFEQSDVEEAKRYVLQKHLQSWSPVLRGAIESCSKHDTFVRPWSLYMLPLGFRWTSQPGITLIGDAAHLMTPFAGEGVNQGLTDVKELVECLQKTIHPIIRKGGHPTKIQLVKAANEAIQKYESNLLPRMEIFMYKTFDMMNLNFNNLGGLYGNIEKWILTAIEDEIPLRFITLPIVSLIVHAYYLFFRLWYRPQKSA